MLDAYEAYVNLRQNQRQLDADGCEVGVSRQALEEILAAYAELVAPKPPLSNSTHDKGVGS
jgi:hypothetical protein